MLRGFIDPAHVRKTFFSTASRCCVSKKTRRRIFIFRRIMVRIHRRKPCCCLLRFSSLAIKKLTFSLAINYPLMWLSFVWIDISCLFCFSFHEIEYLMHEALISSFTIAPITFQTKNVYMLTYWTKIWPKWRAFLPIILSNIQRVEWKAETRETKHYSCVLQWNRSTVKDLLNR